jgi:hypothetical protein
MSWYPAYAAGFFDGEGCITVGMNKREGGYSRIRVQITQMDIRPLLFIQEQFGGQIVRERDCWQLHWCGKKALPFLEAIEPYLFVKREQVALAIEFISHIGVKGQHIASENSRTRRLEIMDEIRQAKVVVLSLGTSTWTCSRKRSTSLTITRPSRRGLVPGAVNR